MKTKLSGLGRRSFWRRVPVRLGWTRRPRIAVLAVAATLILAAGATPVFLRSPFLRFRVYGAASGLLTRTLDFGLTIYDPFHLPTSPVCNCSSGWEYRCDDPDQDYFRRVREDPRLTTLFQAPRNSLETYADMQNFLRDQFPHGFPLNPSGTATDDYDLLQRLDDAAAGSSFLCGDISKMLLQLVQASRGFARLVSLFDPAGDGHVVTEIWVEDANKWVVFDPDFNVYFTDRSGSPLNALELHEIYRSGDYGRAIVHRGASRNASYEHGFHAFYLSHYDSMAFNRRADFVQARYPRFHPNRQPATTLSAWADGAAFGRLAVRDRIGDASELYFKPCRPGELGERTHAPADARR